MAEVGNNSDRRIRITASDLKKTAAALMIICHLYAVLTGKNDNGPVNGIITAVTRASFVIFAFLLTEGMKHTGNRKRYIWRLFIFALISEVPFDLFTFGKVFDLSRQNVIFDLAAGAVGIYFADRYNERYIKILILAAVTALASVIRADYAHMGVLLIFVFYYMRDHKAGMYIAAAAVLYLCTLYAGQKEALIQLCGAWAFIPIELYDGTRGRNLPGWFYYILYPAHLLILSLPVILQTVCL